MELRPQIYQFKKNNFIHCSQKVSFLHQIRWNSFSRSKSQLLQKKKTVVHSAFTHCVHYVESWFVRFFSIICDQNFSLFCASFDFESCLAHSWSLSEPWRENDELYDYTYAPAYRQCLLFLFCAKSQNHELYSEKKKNIL